MHFSVNKTMKDKLNYMKPNCKQNIPTIHTVLLRPYVVQLFCLFFVIETIIYLNVASSIVKTLVKMC